MSEISKIFEGLPKRYNKANVKTPRTFYFSLGEAEKWTVLLGKEKCEVTPGKPAADADCFFKGTEEMFLNVWAGKYTPTVTDFLTGAIKSNNPLLLKDFIAAFSK